MKDKINIAELLKDCPKGMELDCALYDNVFFDGIDTNDDNFPISLYYKHNNIKNGFSVTKYGTYYNHQNTKCIIFPKGKTTWEGFIPPCKFKDGDIVYAIDEGNEYIFIFKEIYENERVYCYLYLKGGDLRIQEVWLTDYNPTHRFATEEEKQKLFDAIKANGYKWNEENKTLEKLIVPKFKVGDKIRLKENHNYIYTITDIREEENKYGCGVSFVLRFSEQDNWELVPNKFDITTLKPFESRVLVRGNIYNFWEPAIFGFIKDKFFYILGGAAYEQCIPYKNNEHLLGTKNDCDDFYKTW